MNVAIEGSLSDGPRSVSGREDLSLGAEHDGSIGDIIRRVKNLSEEQMTAVLEHQRQHGTRFGEAAVALGFISDADVVFALSQQFHYPFASEDRRAVNRELIAASQPFSAQAEVFRAIRSQLLLRAFSPSQPRQALAVISPDSGDGKTFFAANLAVVLAQTGNRTLVVDGDLRGPRLHEVFGIPNTSGLSGILSGRQDDNVIFQVPDIPSLYVMPVGVTPPNPLELIERPAFRLLMNELLRKFDHVVVDTPAATHGSDYATLASRCGAALVVARKDRARLKDIEAMAQVATMGNATLAGVVMNEF